MIYRKILYRVTLFLWRKKNILFNDKKLNDTIWRTVANIEKGNTQIIYLTDFNLVYMAIPKVANSSIKTLLAQNIGLKGNLNRKGGLAYLFNHHKEAKILNQKGILISKNKLNKLKKDNKNLKIFTVVRDPIDRLYSFYASCLASEVLMKKLINFYGPNSFSQGMSFKQFIEQVIQIPDLISNRHFQSQYLFLKYKNKYLVDNIFRFDQLNKELVVFLEASGIETGSFNNVNKGIFVEQTEKISSNLKFKVRKRYLKDYNLIEKI